MIHYNVRTLIMAQVFTLFMVTEISSSRIAGILGLVQIFVYFV